MRLDFHQIRSVTTGAVRITEGADGVRFYRFTQEQENRYQRRDLSLYQKSFCPSGIRLCFRTDSKSLFLKILTETATTRTYFSLDVFVNGNMVGAIDNFDGMDLPADYSVVSFPLGTFSSSFDLGVGEKEVSLYLPWSVKMALQEIALDDGASVIPAKPEKKLLCFGDSITQGYDAMRPSNKYITRLADFLGAQEFNKAIGAEIFFPELAAAKEDFLPDLITVAYGTNDWSKRGEEAFRTDCRKFYQNLRTNYPETKICAISPVWRKDWQEPREFGAFRNVEAYIRSVAEEVGNAVFVSGFDLIPQDEYLCGDLRLHPNDRGFAYYFENLCKKLEL